MRRTQIVIWGGLTFIFGGFGLLFAFYNLETALVGLFVYLPLTAGIAWLTVTRRKAWFGLWFLLFLAWLTYIGPLIAFTFEQFGFTRF